MMEEFSLENNQQNAGNTPANPAAADAIAAASQSKRGRGRPRKDGANSGGTGDVRARTMSPELRAEIARSIEVCYDPKTWGQLLSMPADTALAITGKDRWNIAQSERDTLGACGSTAARFLVIENPKTLALMMLSSALISVYLPRCIGELKDMAAAKKTQSKPDAKSDGTN